MAATSMIKLQAVLLLVVLATVASSVHVVSAAGCREPWKVRGNCLLVLQYGPDPAFLSGCCGEVARDCVCDLLGRHDDLFFSNAVRKAINAHCRLACH